MIYQYHLPSVEVNLIASKNQGSNRVRSFLSRTSHHRFSRQGDGNRCTPAVFSFDPMIKKIDSSIGSQFIGCIVMAVAEISTNNIRSLTMQGKMNKEDWVAMFREAGMSDDAMMKWHRLFEARHPEAHEDFLACLGIPADEITLIRSNAR